MNLIYCTCVVEIANDSCGKLHRPSNIPRCWGDLSLIGVDLLPVVPTFHSAESGPGADKRTMLQPIKVLEHLEPSMKASFAKRSSPLFALEKRGSTGGHLPGQGVAARSAFQGSCETGAIWKANPVRCLERSWD